MTGGLISFHACERPDDDVSDEKLNSSIYTIECAVRGMTILDNFPRSVCGLSQVTLDPSV